MNVEAWRKPTILDSIIDFERWSLSNPMNGCEWAEMTFIKVAFKQEFGPWKMGQKIDCLRFDLMRGILSEGDNWGNMRRCCSLQISPLVIEEFHDH